MKKSFKWVLIGNLTIAVLIVLSDWQYFSSARTSYMEAFAIPMLVLSCIDVLLGIAVGLFSIFYQKLRPYTFPLLISGLVLFLVGFSFCTATFSLEARRATIDAPEDTIR